MEKNMSGLDLEFVPLLYLFDLISAITASIPSRALIKLSTRLVMQFMGLS